MFICRAFSAVVFGGMAIGQASAMAPDAAKAQTSAEQIFKLLDRKPAIGGDEETKKAVTPPVSLPVFKTLSFCLICRI